MKTSGKLLVIIAGLVFSLIAIPLLALFVSTSTAQAYRGQPGPAAGQTQTAQGQTCPNCTGQGV
ncbi:MAG TPA: hypothetical protein VH186_19745, partial [Chloroflexia bacterium]|nr:hypothetical protein [Chloroflexia bacterium]